MTPKQQIIYDRMISDLSANAAASLSLADKLHFQRLSILMDYKPVLTRPLEIWFKAMIERRVEIPEELYSNILELYRRDPDLMTPVEEVIKQQLKMQYLPQPQVTN